MSGLWPGCAVLAVHGVLDAARTLGEALPSVLERDVPGAGRGPDAGSRLTVLGVFSLGFAVATASASGAGLVQPALFFAFVTSVLFILFAVEIAGALTSLLVMFACFNLLYAISGPIAALYGDGLGSLFSTPYETGGFLFLFGLSMIGLILCGVIEPVGY